MLPAELRAAVATLLGAGPCGALAGQTRRLSQHYRSGQGSHLAVTGVGDIAAYLTARLPATYAAVEAALQSTAAQLADFRPATILDAGAGPGTASWAAAGIWSGVRAITMLDMNTHFLGAAKTLAASASHPALRGADIRAGDVGAFDAAPCDLVLASYALGELEEEQASRALIRLWQACLGVLVIVEPGTPASFARLMRWRGALMVNGARMIAPCPHENPCPLIAPDWCHFTQRLARSRDHMRAKGARLPFEDEKFSYAAFARDEVAVADRRARIIAPARKDKTGIRLRLCTETGVGEHFVAKRDAARFKPAAKKDWGDVL